VGTGFPSGFAAGDEQSQEKWASVFRPVLRQTMSKASTGFPSGFANGVTAG
jgi:hypothetical protein